MTGVLFVGTLRHCCMFSLIVGWPLNRVDIQWRHDSVLSNIVALIQPKLAPGSRLFSDLPGFHAPGGGSIPPNVLVTTSRPDIFIVNETSWEIIVFKLMFVL